MFQDIKIVRLKKKIKIFFYQLGLMKTNSIWPFLSERQKKYLVKNVNIVSANETIAAIKKTIEMKMAGAYMRFGDGDVLLMLGVDDCLHKANEQMSKEMREAMKLNYGVMHKGLPIHSKLFGVEEGMKDGVHLLSDDVALKYLSVTYRYIDLSRVYNHVALHQLATINPIECIDFLRFLKGTNPILVGNETIKPDLIEKLFSSIHIKTPSRDSYNEIDRIENDLIKVLNTKRGEFQVVVIAMGCPGRILQKRILKKRYNVYLFDFGSLLDAFNDHNSRAWIRLTGGLENYTKLLQSLD